MTKKDDIRWLRACYELAKLSKDPSTQNAAIILSRGKILTSSVNRMPFGVQDTDERWQRPLKYKYVQHAESGAIVAAAKAGLQTRGCVMYCPWFACTDCAKAIIDAGIACVIGHDHPLHATREQWAEEARIADEMFVEAGVKFERIKDKLGLTFRFDGNMVEA